MKRRFVKTSKEWRQRLLYAASAIASAFADYCSNEQLLENVMNKKQIEHVLEMKGFLN